MKFDSTNMKSVYKKSLIIEKIRDIKNIKLYVRPPRTVEYIEISFTILPTGGKFYDSPDIS